MENNTLFNAPSKESAYFDKKELYQNHLLEQYKVYLEMTDRISARRNLANVFFLTLNTSLIATIGFTFENIKLINPPWLIAFPILGFITLNVVWWWLIKSYKGLNSAKFKVIGLLEKKLPSQPYYGEWIELGEGKNYKKYLPFTILEKWVPVIFIILYSFVLIYVIFLIS